MKLKTNLRYDARPHTYRRVWIDENVDLFIMVGGEKCIIRHDDFRLKLPGNIRLNPVSWESKEDPQ